MRISEETDTLQHGDLAHLRHRGEPAGELSDHLVLERAQLGEVELRLAKRDAVVGEIARGVHDGDRKSTRLNSSHLVISYAVFCLKKKKKRQTKTRQRCSSTS